MWWAFPGLLHMVSTGLWSGKLLHGVDLYGFSRICTEVRGGFSPDFPCCAAVRGDVVSGNVVASCRRIDETRRSAEQSQRMAVGDSGSAVGKG